MKLHVKKVPRGYKLRVRRYDAQTSRIYGFKIFDVLIGISFVWGDTSQWSDGVMDVLGTQNPLLHYSNTPILHHSFVFLRSFRLLAYSKNFSPNGLRSNSRVQAERS
jgi:hypothetical protein